MQYYSFVTQSLFGNKRWIRREGEGKRRRDRKEKRGRRKGRVIPRDYRYSRITWLT